MSDVVSTNPAAASSGTKKSRAKWTEKTIAAEALKYPTRNAFYRESTAYVAASRHGLLDKVCTHMDAHEWQYKGRTRWTEETIAAEALKYRTRKAFYKESSAYAAASKRGVLDKVCAHMTSEEPRKGRTNWTEEMLAVEAKKYSTRVAFQRGSPNAYKAARCRGILDRICTYTATQTSWDYDMLAAEAAKYATRKAFQIGSTSAYGVAKSRNILDQICEHMSVLRVDWDEDMLRAEAAKYTTRVDFQKFSQNAYSAAYRKGALDTVCGHMIAQRENWSDREEADVAEEALKYETRSEFQKGSSGAYTAARSRGILDEVCAHMKPSPWVEKDAVYLWRANNVRYQGRNVYKIGITLARLGDDRIHQVARASGFRPTIVCIAKVTENARFLESEFLKLGLDPGFTGFGGCTEFRALTPEEVDSILCIIDLYADEPLPVAA